MLGQQANMKSKENISAHIPLEIGCSTQMKSTQTISNVHAQREKFAFGTQRNLYSTDLCWGFALGETQILGLASGVTQILAFLDTNMLVYPTQMPGPNTNGFASQWNIGFSVIWATEVEKRANY